MTQLPAHLSSELFEQLSIRQQQFVLHPEVLTNVEKAAIEVGYSPTFARARAASLRRQLMYYIRPINDERMAAAGITLDRVQDELAAVAFAQEPDYYDTVDTDEGPMLVAKDVSLLPERMRRAIKGMEIETILGANNVPVGQNVSFALHDKQVALKLLAEMLGGFDPRSRQPADTETRRKQAELFTFMTHGELDTITKIYRRAEDRQRRQATDAEVIEAPQLMLKQEEEA